MVAWVAAKRSWFWTSASAPQAATPEQYAELAPSRATVFAERYSGNAVAVPDLAGLVEINRRSAPSR